MLRQALSKLVSLEASSQEDTVETIKQIIEWRGRVSIVTDVDRAFALNTLQLDTDNSAGLLDLYDVIGPGASWRPSSNDAGNDLASEDDEEGDETESDNEEEHEDELPPVGWPLLTGDQDEVDEIVFRTLGPRWQPSHNDTLGTVASEHSSSSSSSSDVLIGFGPRMGGRGKPSPLHTSWSIEASERHLVHIRVSHEGLTGSIPQSIRRLRFLETLELPVQRIWYDPWAAHERIPRECKPKIAHDVALSASLGYLTALRTLNLHGNLLTGTIPRGLGNLARLAELDLSRNRFTGNVPGELGNLEHLTSLDMSENRLDGNFEHDFFFGKSLPSSSFTIRTTINGSSKGDNSTGSRLTPDADNDATSATAQGNGPLRLVRLLAPSNALCGKLPGEGLAQLRGLQELDLSGNMLSGNVAVELPNRLGRSLRILDLHNNLLEGRLPGTLRDLNQCRHIDLSGNLFCGRLPLALACCKQLTYLDVSDNQWSCAEIAELRDFLQARLHVAAPNVFV